MDIQGAPYAMTDLAKNKPKLRFYPQRLAHLGELVHVTVEVEPTCA